MNAMKRTTCLLLCCAVLASALLLGGCQRQEAEELTAVQTENLAKLCKVWGYVKYTHPAFLLGKRDWDAELLELIPQVRAAEAAEETNALLHEWFQSLGEIDYGRTMGSIRVSESKQVIVADTSWIVDTAYLGEDLAEDLAQLPETVPTVDRTNAPAAFTFGTPDFGSEQDYDPSYGDVNFRLLGLFRLWNAIEYFFPYLHLMDRDWEESLTEYIPVMLGGADQESYEKSIAGLAACIQDSHVRVFPVSAGMHQNNPAYLGREHRFPAILTEAEGKLVVQMPADHCPLEAGDVLVSINGHNIDELSAEIKQYYSYSRDEVLLQHFGGLITLSETEDIEAVILRRDEELALTVQSSSTYSNYPTLPPYEILDGGIGLINPSKIESVQDTQEVVDTLCNMQALIIDLRQYPGESFMDLYRWIVGEDVPFFVWATPWPGSPGTYSKNILTPSHYALTTSDYDSYNKPVVVLMNNTSMSYGETAIMAFREGENVVLMGENSMGANGDVTILPLPGAISMAFSSVGVYTMNGDQTQRTGITPDIRVEPTIQGIAEGRDELMEAAIAYLQKKN